jgi:hypothetical protein
MIAAWMDHDPPIAGSSRAAAEALIDAATRDSRSPRAPSRHAGSNRGYDATSAGRVALDSHNVRRSQPSNPLSVVADLRAFVRALKPPITTAATGRPNTP